MILKLLTEAMQLHKIDAKYKNENLIVINGISIYINNGLAQFGTCRFRYSDPYEFCFRLGQEGLLDLSEGDRHKIQSDYKRLLNRLV